MMEYKHLIPIVIIGVAIAYYLVGEVALGGLLAVLFGTKGKQKSLDDSLSRADMADEWSIREEAKAQQATAQADEKREENLDIAEEITEPNEVEGNRSKRKFSAK